MQGGDHEQGESWGFRLRGDRDLYLVGGTVRDILMGIEPQDYDFSVSGSGIEFAHHVGRKIKGAVIVLDEEEDEARVVKDNIVYDFIGLEEHDVVSELQRRDFTMNAMAVHLADFEFLDPCAGARDLKKRLIRPTTPESLIADPLRILIGHLAIRVNPD